MPSQIKDPTKRFLGRLCTVQPNTHAHATDATQSERYILNSSCCMCVRVNANRCKERDKLDPSRTKANTGKARPTKVPLTKEQYLEARKIQRRNWVAKDPESVQAYQKAYHAAKRLENPEVFDKYRQTQIDRGHTGPYGKDKLLSLTRKSNWDSGPWDSNG